MYIYLAIFVGSLILGFIIGRAKRYTGTLQVDKNHGNPQKYRIVIDNFEDLDTKSVIILKVDRTVDLSH